MAKIFSIYRSSAGSGKTRTLAKEYLRLALQHKSGYFQYILAVTFTNKASQEMKDRIIHYLHEFASDRGNELAQELKSELNLDDLTFQQRAQECLQNILHDYAQFSISTIDAFFQKVIRSFTRETGLVGDYRLEVEQDAVLEQVIDNLIDELGPNKELTEWVVEFAKENLENEKAWDVRYSLIEFAKEIFREEFKNIEDEVRAVTAEPNFFKDLKQTLWKVKGNFLSNVSASAQKALSIIKANGWTAEDFSYGKNSGLITFFKIFAFEKTLAKIKEPGGRIKTHFTYPEKWPAKNHPEAQKIKSVADQELVPLVLSILEEYDASYVEALTAETALKNLYVFGLISDIARKLKEYKDENNLMLLADAPKFLNGVIQDSDTPFIYEKVGSFYRHYLIDEFQDTSGMQWKNFQPLILNSLDQGQQSFVVGDVKQAIYRWRGGDLNLLQNEITRHVGEHRVESKKLDKNFRSVSTVVNFNNTIFQSASKIVSAHTGTSTPINVYDDVAQEPFKNNDEGFVRLTFIKEEDGSNLYNQTQEEAEESNAKWKAQALDLIPQYFEELQAVGVQLKDIAIIVRKNDEGQIIANHLINYKNSTKAKEGFRYDVVSNESLRIDGASTVNLLLGAMQYLLNPENAIARAQLAFEYSRLHEPGRDTAEIFAVGNQMHFENNLPHAFSKEKGYLKKLGLIELTETLIEIFKLGVVQGELIYLQAFQDLVLDFYSREKNDLGAFLEWWEDNKHKKSIQISGEVNAAQIITIHKSKGLQFKYVIIPFCSWAMDHDNWQAPNLWVKSAQEPFDKAGYLPVKYTGTLANTYFKEFYEEERTKTFLDNLNLLYVAFTRAEAGLFISAPHPEVRQSKDTVATLVYDSIQQNETLKDLYNDSSCLFSSGEIKNIEGRKKEIIPAIRLNRYASIKWQQKLVIKKSAPEFFEQEVNEHQAKINYGLLIHDILAEVKNTSDVKAAIHKKIDAGEVTEEESIMISHSIETLFKSQQVKKWFDTSWQVKTEVPIILPNGDEARIDRLLIQNKEATIVDFKTGSPNKKDEAQVKQYMEILRQMNFVKVEGFLLYLKDNTIIEIKSEGKQRVVKKAPTKDQLSLGF